MGDPDSSEIESALAALGADELRALVLETLQGMLWEDEERPRRRLVNSLVERAARNSSAWTATSPAADDVSEILSFVDVAKRVGYADPSDIDDRLQKGSNAFLAKDYAAAA